VLLVACIRGLGGIAADLGKHTGIDEFIKTRLSIDPAECVRACTR
jgi:hypothetical protein